MPSAPTYTVFPAISNPLVLASHNQGKLREIRDLLAPYGFSVVDAGHAGVTEPEETGDSFKANALLKARHSAAHTQACALADDSGLCVDALDGAPGIYSARFAGEEKDFSRAMEKINRLLHEKNHPATGARAYFACALSLAWPNGQDITVEGRVHGALTFPPRGEKGFGYDPIFIPDGHTQTFAEIAPEEKHRISHRADAFSQLLQTLKEHKLLPQSTKAEAHI